MANGTGRLNHMLKRLERDLSGRRKDEPEKFPRNPETGLPEPKNFKELLATVEEVVSVNRKMFNLVRQLEEALPQEDEKQELISSEQFLAKYLTGNIHDDPYKMMFGVNPASIALISLDQFFANTDRFTHIDPTTLEFHKDLFQPYQGEKITHTSIEIGGKTVSVPVNNEFWVEDKELGAKFVINYKPAMGGQVTVTIYSSYDDDEKNLKLGNEIRLKVLQSPFIKGQVIEISEGSGFNVVDIGDQPFPIISDELKEELEKNVINMFDKSADFKALGQSISRSIILAGGPGNGKTMIERWLASRVRGKVTTVWVSAKSIIERDNIDDIFEIARKLAPALIIMEDLDLISGTRMHYGNDNMLGEMLNQLDGLKKNDEIVIVASTNRVEDLDEALNDRPGRFDRIFEVTKPTAPLAQRIASEYLKKCNLSDETIKGMNLPRYFKDQEFSGAQIVDIAKGAIHEAVFRGLGSNVNEQCLKASKEGLEKQRLLIQKKQKREE